MRKEVIIIGASGHGKVIADIIEKSSDRVFGFLDDADNLTTVFGYPVMGKVSDCEKYKNKYFIIAIGNNEIRRRISATYKELKYYTAIHPTAVLSKDIKLGCGTAVMANAVVNASAVIGNHCIINTGAIIEHDNILEDYVHISPKAALGGTVRVGKNTHIGIGATVRNNINICDDCIIGAGAVVVKDIVNSGTYVGVPVKEL